MGWQVRRRFHRERSNIYLQLIDIVIWQKPTHYKAIIFQFKNMFFLDIYSKLQSGKYWQMNNALELDREES